MNKSGDSRLYIKVSIFNHLVETLLDSGASHSVVGKKGLYLLNLFELTVFKCEQLCISTADGKGQNIQGYINLPIQFENSFKILKVLVVPSLLHELILGSDFCDLFKLNINFHNRTCSTPDPCKYNLATVNVIRDRDSLSANERKDLDYVIKLFEQLSWMDGMKLGRTSRTNKTKATSHFTLYDEILEVTAGKKASEVSSLIGTLADILLITTSRQAHRMFFPINALYLVCNIPTDTRGYVLAEDATPTMIKGRIDYILKNFNVSGNGGFYAYMLLTHMHLYMEGTMDSIQASQILFHGIFGTFKEDLTILGQITSLATWQTREEMGNIFQKANTSGKRVTFRPPTLLYYSKLSSDNQTRKLASAYVKTCALPVFSGNRIQSYSDDFFEQIGKRIEGTTSGKTVPQISSALTTILSVLTKELRDGACLWGIRQNVEIGCGAAFEQPMVKSGNFGKEGGWRI
ncbi:hypothetical protein QE152_g38432 [Popillia japonica]|uniref:Peptidase A2 domain-containing protein n=1 Tax=Popillia japonica TaxID=7064 RepID=A0AAW1HWJ9_POPJA